MFRRGSLKWVGINKWGFYVDMFLSISSGDQASMAMSPREWMACWEEYPRVMAILQLIQKRVRFQMSDEVEKAKAKAQVKHGNARHV